MAISLVWAVAAVFMMLRAGYAGVFPLARQKSFDGFGSVARAAAMDLNALSLEHIHRALSHAARQQDRNALLFENSGNIRLASTARRRKHGPGLLNDLVPAHTEKRELGAMAKVVIDGAVGAGGHGNYGKLLAVAKGGIRTSVFNRNDMFHDYLSLIGY